MVGDRDIGSNESQRTARAAIAHSFGQTKRYGPDSLQGPWCGRTSRTMILAICDHASSQQKHLQFRETKMPRRIERKPSDLTVDRRKFLTGVAIAGAASTGSAKAANAAAATAANGARVPSALPPTAEMIAAETTTPKVLAKAQTPDGSDFMVDVIKTLNIDYLPSNPASSFRGL